MLAREKRLNLKKDFKWVASGKSISSQYVKLYFKVESQTNGPKIGIALSSKYFKKAHERNRARRLTSAALEALVKFIPKSLNIVALPKTGILDVKSNKLFDELKQMLSRQNLISNGNKNEKHIH